LVGPQEAAAEGAGTAAAGDKERRRRGLRGLLARAHSNTVVVALAAKMARTVWALLRYGTTFEPRAIAI